MNNVDGEHQIMDSLTYQAVHDPLTGLYNRNYFRSRAKELLEEHPFLNYAFVEMDVDHFKQINDTYGHTAGDQVLMRLGRIMKECTRREDMAVRLGGDEFLLFYIMDEVPDAPVKRLFERVKEDREGIPFTISCGITTTVLSGRDYEKLYRDADQALYEAKKDGRNCYRIYKENK
jgi:diguanylate cyclase (GGDEF)-like protein